MNTQPRKKCIVLVDDDPINNMINVKMIERSFSFVKIKVFTNPNEALDQLKKWAASETENFPGLILLDINMPQIDGWEFLEEFEKLPAYLLDKCTVIMLSSSIDRKDIERSKTFKTVKDFISKPLSQHNLEIIASVGLN